MWLTVASGAVVFTEPAPVDVLTMGLVVLLPVIGLVAISRGPARAAGADAGGGGRGLPGGDQSPSTSALAVTHTAVSLYLYVATFVFAAFVAKRPEAHARLILNAYTWAAWWPRLAASSAISTWCPARTS